MPRFPKPAEGSWTEHYPQLGTGPVSYEDSINPDIYQLERAAIFKRAWLNVGRVELLPRKGSYFTNGYTYTGHPVSCAAALAEASVEPASRGMISVF